MTASTISQSYPAAEGLVFLQEALAATAALDAADRLGVLDRLNAGPADPLTLARDCGMSQRGARLLLAALAGLGLVEIAGDGSYRTALPSLGHLAELGGMWDRLGEALRDGRPAVAGDTVTGAGAPYQDALPYLGALCAPAAERAADRLSVPGLHVLDVGAGVAPWSLAFAVRDPDCRVTAVDLQAVLPATCRAVAAVGREVQFRYLAGDLFTVDWGRAAYDLAIAGNVCHLFDEAANRRLLGRLFDALCPGGTLAIVDALPNERLDGPRPVVLYALGLLLRTSRGGVYPFSTYAGWLRDAGYEAVERFDLSAAPPLSLITARRP